MDFRTFVENHQSRIFYRGTNPGDQRRIRTGAAFWDSLLFAADNIKAAQSYGNKIEIITAKPTAKILYEGSKDFKILAKTIPKAVNLLTFCDQITQKAAQNGYHAVYFTLQGTIGTAIIDPSQFVREQGDLENGTIPMQDVRPKPG